MDDWGRAFEELALLEELKQRELLELEGQLELLELPAPALFFFRFSPIEWDELELPELEVRQLELLRDSGFKVRELVMLEELVPDHPHPLLRVDN